MHWSGSHEMRLAWQIANHVGAFCLASIRRAETGLAFGAVLFLVLDGRGLIRLHAVTVRHVGVARDVLHRGRGRERDSRHDRNAERYEHSQKSSYIAHSSTCHAAG